MNPILHSHLLDRRTRVHPQHAAVHLGALRWQRVRQVSDGRQTQPSPHASRDADSHSGRTLYGIGRAGVGFRTEAFESEHPDSSRNATSNRSPHSEPIPVTASGDDRLGDRFRTTRASLARAVPRNSARAGSFFAPFGLVRVVPLCRFQEAPVKALPEKRRSTWASTESL